MVQGMHHFAGALHSMALSQCSKRLIVISLSKVLLVQLLIHRLCLQQADLNVIDKQAPSKSQVAWQSLTTFWNVWFHAGIRQLCHDWHMVRVRQVA